MITIIKGLSLILTLTVVFLLLLILVIGPVYLADTTGDPRWNWLYTAHFLGFCYSLGDSI